MKKIEAIIRPHKLEEVNDALKDIKKDTELTADYRHTPYFIQKPDPSWK